MSIVSEKRLAAELAKQMRGQIKGQRWRDVLIGGLTLPAGLIGNFVFNKIEIAAVLWSITLLALADLIFTWKRLAQVPVIKRILADVLIVGLLWIPSYPPVHELYRTQHAALLQGDLQGAGLTFNDGIKRLYPRVQIGNTGTILQMTPNGTPTYFKQFADAEFKVEPGRMGPLVSTTVRDGDGKTVVDINRNHWHCYPPYCQDKNSTHTAFEVLDSSSHVVLQIRLLPDRVQVQGEWWDNQGNGERIIAVNGQSQVQPLGPKIKRNETLIKPIFVYPSQDHWRELVQ